MASTASGYVPGGVDEVVLTVNVEEPPAVIGLALKEPEAPEGSPGCRIRVKVP